MLPIVLLAMGFACGHRGDYGRTARVRTAITLYMSSPPSPPPAPPPPVDEVDRAFDRAFAMAKAMGDHEVAKEYLRLFISTCAGKSDAHMEKLIAYECARTASRDVQIERLIGEKKALVAEKETLRESVDTLTLDLAKYEAIMQPCSTIEMALRAKYPPQKGAPFVATTAWARFFATAIGDGYAEEGNEIAMTPEPTGTEDVE